MGSLSTPKLPVVNFSKDNLKPGTSSWFSIRNDVRQALEEYGCFVAAYDKVPIELHNDIFSQVKELFDLPVEIKMKNTSEKPYFGYVGSNQPLVSPLYESMGIEYASTLEGTQTFTNLIWPEGNDHFCKTALSYSKLVSELEQMVKRMVFESYGVEKYYDSHMESCAYLLKLMQYKRPDMIETNLGCETHTDKGFLTILHQNEVSGLEVKAKDGDWIGFEPSPSSFIVMAGDAFMAWSNGRIHSPPHRVVISGSKVRYSLGLFSLKEGMIHVPEELVDDEHPLLFKPFDQYGLLGYFVTGQTQREESSALSYCAA